jgi:hypothetical protein
MRSRPLLVLLVIAIAVLGLARSNLVQTETPSASPVRATADAIDRDRTRAGDLARRSNPPRRSEPSTGLAAQRSRGTAKPGTIASEPGFASRQSNVDHGAASALERTLGLRDRVGLRDGLGEALRTEFEPLAAECLDQASERAPRLRGMLALEFSIVPDPEAGSIVESVEPTAGSQVADAELVECIRQTMLSASLPASEEPQALMITIDVGGP